MCYLSVLRLRQSVTLNRCLVEQCWRQYLCQTRLYVAGRNSHKNGVNINNNNAKQRRKALRMRILQDIKHTKRKVEEIIERENIWTVPNVLCIGRIVTSPFLSYLILSHDYQV